MTLLKFLLNKCRFMVVIMVIAALLSGVANAAMLAVINQVINSREHTTLLFMSLFGVLVIAKLLTGFLSQVWLIRFFQQTIADLRRGLVKKVLDVPLRQYEKIGPGRIMAALTDDIKSLTSALFAFPLLMVNISILMGGAAYLGWLSWQILAAMVVFALLGAACYRLIISKGFHSLRFAREAEDRLFGHFRSLTEGLKELKLHRERRQSFLSDGLHKVTGDFQRHSVSAETRFLIAHSWSNLLFYLLIGLIIFLMPVYSQMDFKTLTGYVLTTLYLVGPLGGVLGSISVFTRAEVALRKISSLGITLDSERVIRSAVPTAIEDGCGFEQIEFNGISHSYPNESGDDQFVLGPLDLTFKAGELVFIVGGNGSGKSTLAKIITGLYPPETGEILLDGVSIDDANRDDYRQLFSAVFSDFHLFDDLLGLKADDLDERANAYLGKFHLDHKVKVLDGKLSTTALSQGQRKRLALLTSYLENRSFYMFDEWAADQDPYFKHIFYNQLLPELKARGKTVLVITHDDQYFGVADRVLKLDYGQLVETPLHVFEQARASAYSK